jgi:hypothetical protein
MNRLSNKELVKLAQDIKGNLIFHSNMLDNLGLIHSVFMPLALMEHEELVKIAPHVGLFYEYLTESGPRTINGYPIFTSVRMIHREDIPKLQEILNKLDRAEKSVLEELE